MDHNRLEAWLRRYGVVAAAFLALGHVGGFVLNAVGEAESAWGDAGQAWGRLAGERGQKVSERPLLPPCAPPPSS